MDTDDVSNVGRYIQYLTVQKATLKAAEAREGQIPNDRSSRADLVKRQEMALMQSRMRELNLKNTGQKLVLSSFLPPPYPPSVASMDELKSLLISDLKIGVHHRGHYLVVRAITEPTRMTAILTVVEDQKKDAVLLQLYQQPDEYIQPSTSIITTGDVLLVKEPFFKVVGDGGYGLRVDHVTDILFIDPKHKLYPAEWTPNISSLPKTADDWKREGNAAVEKKQYWKAIEHYTSALKNNPSASEASIIRLNRALAYLQDGSFEAALIDTQNLDTARSTSEKALYRASKALYGMGRFNECCEVLEDLLQKYPNNSEATKELRRARLRSTEQQHGHFDFKCMYKEAAKVRPPHLDHATYIGPVVVKESAGRGKGMFTTRAVTAGELLLCEKAFAHCYAGSEAEDSEGSANTTLLMNIHTNRMTMGTQADLITSIVQKLLRNSYLLPEFNSLHHGSYEAVHATEVDGHPIIDTFLVEKIITTNSFGCALTTKELHLQSTKAEQDNNVIKHHSSGIWPLASRINHSCLSNVRRSFIGDFQIVRATCDIPADTEIMFWYKIPIGDHAEMHDGLQHWGFECTCIICKDSKSTPNKLLTKRKKLLGDLKAVLGAATVDTAKAERILKAAGETYKRPVRDVPRLALRAPFSQLANIYMMRKDAVKTVDMALKSMESLGFVIKGARLPTSSQEEFRVEKWGVMVDDVVSMFISLGNAYYIFAPESFSPSTECAKLAYKICVGENETFKDSYDPVDNMV